MLWFHISVFPLYQVFQMNVCIEHLPNNEVRVWTVTPPTCFLSLFFTRTANQKELGGAKGAAVGQRQENYSDPCVIPSRCSRVQKQIRFNEIKADWTEEEFGFIFLFSVLLVDATNTVSSSECDPGPSSLVYRSRPARLGEEDSVCAVEPWSASVIV